MRLHPWIFEDPAFVRNMEKIPVAAVRFFLCRSHRNVVLPGIIDHRRSRIKEPHGVPPCRDNPDAWVQCRVCQLKSHLIISLACGTMGNGISPFCRGNLNLSFCNERPRERCAHKIGALIDGIGPESRKDKVSYEFFL